MQRRLSFILFLFFCSNCIAQQLPFVYYTPRDGLVNSRVRNIIQDSRGRMFFLTFGGLSIYDGTKFFNYNGQNGLSNDLVNDVLQLGLDSFWIATNNSSLHTLVNGKIRKLITEDGFYPIINKLLKTENGDIYAAADDGLYRWQQNKFIPVRVNDSKGNKILNLNKIVEYRGWAILTQWVSQTAQHLVVINLKNNQEQFVLNEPAFDLTVKDGNELWICFADKLRILNNEKLQQHIIAFDDAAFLNEGKPLLGSIAFDTNNNLWIIYAHSIAKVDSTGKKQVIADEQGLKATNINSIFFDREGIMWLATDGSGVMKLTGTNLQVLTNFDGKNNSSISCIYASETDETVWFCDRAASKIYSSSPAGNKTYPMKNLRLLSGLLKNNKAIYLSGEREVFKIKNTTSSSSFTNPEKIYTLDSGYISRGVVDKYGNIIQLFTSENDSFGIHCLVNEKTACVVKVPYLIDQFAFDTTGRLWGATRSNDLMVFGFDPSNPKNYIRLLKTFRQELPVVSPRSIAIDKNNNVWLGTRHDGVFRIRMDDLNIKNIRQFSVAQGLIDNNIITLHCDAGNNIWVGTQSGMDEIVTKNDDVTIKNITKSQNIFQFVTVIASDKPGNIWALCNNGSIIRISPKTNNSTAILPTVFFNEFKVNGRDTDIVTANEFSFGDNNLSFSVAATSFVDERLTRYSYVLEGSGNNNWSESSINASFNFINLAPGDYTLHVKAAFPGALYLPQTVSYRFIILQPWWRTWWFYTAVGLLAVLLIYYAIRTYYRRKLLQQRVVYEKQQAVETERTRIATDMHDDLGAGLTRIKFLSENIAEKNNSLSEKDELQKLKGSANELIESMGEIIWAMNEKNNTLEDLLFHLRSYSITYCEENKLACTFNLPEQIPVHVINGHTRRNTFLIAKECLHNIVKHAHARSVLVDISIGTQLAISIRDDGNGINTNSIAASGNGLINMQKRITEMKGSMQVSSREGTQVEFKIPLTV